MEILINTNFEHIETTMNDNHNNLRVIAEYVVAEGIDKPLLKQLIKKTNISALVKEEIKSFLLKDSEYTMKTLFGAFKKEEYHSCKAIIWAAKYDLLKQFGSGSRVEFQFTVFETVNTIEDLVQLLEDTKITIF